MKKQLKKLFLLSYILAIFFSTGLQTIAETPVCNSTSKIPCVCSNVASATIPVCNSTTKKCDINNRKCVCDPSYVDPITKKKNCCGIKLNTDVPFIGSCIEMGKSNSTLGAGGEFTTDVNVLNAFPVLMGGLSKIMVTSILILSFIAVIAGGVMMAGDGLFGSFGEGRKLVFKVLAGLILLGASGVILKLINPNFFG